MEEELKHAGDYSPSASLHSEVASPSYPVDLICDQLTMSGATVHLRPIRPDDDAGLVEFHHRLSPRSVYRRFFFMHPELSPSEIERFTQVDYIDRMAFVAEDSSRLLAVGRYERSPGGTEAEVAFLVADEYQHHGIGTLLLELLAEAAWRNGITAFVAETLAENHAMLGVFLDSGFSVATSSSGGTVGVRFPIEPDEGYREARAARHSKAERARAARSAPSDPESREAGGPHDPAAPVGPGEVSVTRMRVPPSGPGSSPPALGAESRERKTW